MDANQTCKAARGLACFVVCQGKCKQAWSLADAAASNYCSSSVCSFGTSNLLGHYKRTKEMGVLCASENNARHPRKRGTPDICEAQIRICPCWFRKLNFYLRHVQPCCAACAGHAAAYIVSHTLPSRTSGSLHDMLSLIYHASMPPPAAPHPSFQVELTGDQVLEESHHLRSP